MDKQTTTQGTTVTRAVEASEIGLAPGVWPMAFSHEDLTYYRIAFFRNNENELTKVLYRTSTGQRLEVYND